jgi:autotransporter-associated beta strand protein
MKAAERSRILSTSAAALLMLVVFNPVPLQAGVLTWTGAFGNLWETPPPPASNWSPTSATDTPFTDPGPTTDLIFTGSLNTNTVNDSPGGPGATLLTSITFDAKASNFTLSGFSVFIHGGGFITNNSPNLQVISFGNAGGSGGLALGNATVAGAVAPVTWSAAAGDMLVTCDVSFNNDFGVPGTPTTLIVTGSHNITATGAFFEVPGATGILIKNGTGKLTLTGNSTFLGDTTVNGGVLQVDGSIASIRTFVNPGGTLAGIGLIGGTVFNNGGNVQPGDAPGILTVNGNYFQSHTGTLTIQLTGGNDSQHSGLFVGNHASIDGNLRIVKLGQGPLLKVGDKIDIVAANNGVTGTFSNVSYQTDTIINTKVVYGPGSVSLEQASGYFEKFARDQRLTPNQLAVAQGLDKVAFPKGEPKLVNFLDGEPVGKLPGDFDKIAPEELTSIFTIGTALANVQTTNLQRRTDDIRSGSRGFSAAGFATAGSGPLYSGNLGVAGPSGNDGKESKEMKAVVLPEDRWGAFITGVGEWVSVGDDFNARGYDLTTGGFTLGADYKVTPNLAVGIDAGYAGTAADLNNGGRVFVNGGKLGLYATFFQNEQAAQMMSKDASKDSSKEAPTPAPSLAKGFYADVAVNGGYNSYDTRRDALQGTARGSTDGGELNVLFGTGYDWKMGALSIGPTASFQYTYLGINSFSETGSLAPLRFPTQHQDSLRTAFGMKASYDWKVGGVIVKPELRAAWQHEYGDSSYAMESSFQSGGAFTVNGPLIGRDSLLVGAGFAVMWNERTSTYVYYDGELGRTRYDSQNVSGGIRLSF